MASHLPNSVGLEGSQETSPSLSAGTPFASSSWSLHPKDSIAAVNHQYLASRTRLWAPSLDWPYSFFYSHNVGKTENLGYPWRSWTEEMVSMIARKTSYHNMEFVRDWDSCVSVLHVT